MKFRTKFEPKPTIRRKKTNKNLIIERDGRICHLCNKEIVDDLDFTIDHVISLKNGGPDIIENMKPAHYFCNQFKNDHCPDDIFNMELFKEYKPDIPPIIKSTVSLGDLFMNLNSTKQNGKYRQASP